MVWSWTRGRKVRHGLASLKRCLTGRKVGIYLGLWRRSHAKDVRRRSVEVVVFTRTSWTRVWLSIIRYWIVLRALPARLELSRWVVLRYGRMLGIRE
jgi:hypothetical protein